VKDPGMARAGCIFCETYLCCNDRDARARTKSKSPNVISAPDRVGLNEQSRPKRPEIGRLCDLE